MYKNTQQNVPYQNWAYNFHFTFWNLDFSQVFLLLFMCQSFQGSWKIELKAKLPLVSKQTNKKTNKSHKKIIKKNHSLSFEDMKNPLCTNSFFINCLQNVQSQFLIELKFKGILMQILKCPYMFLFIFLILEILELYTRKVCYMFVYKHTETIEYIKNWPTF